MPQGERCTRLTLVVLLVLGLASAALGQEKLVVV